MFGSWHVNSSKSDPTLLRDSPSVNKACSNCRTKKVKCTGQLLGCARCKALDIQCSYQNDKERRRRTSPEQIARKNTKQAMPRSLLLDSTGPPPADVVPPAEPVIYGYIEPISEFLQNIDDENMFVGNEEHWPMIPSSTAGHENWPPFQIDVDCTSLASKSVLVPDESIYASAPSTSHPGDLIFWDDQFAAAAGFGIDSSTGSVVERDTTASSKCVTTESNSPRLPVQEKSKIPIQAQTQGKDQTQGLELAPCKCMHRIVFLINELDTRLSNDDGYDGGFFHKICDLDSALGLHKEALRYGESMRLCQQCSTRDEKRMLMLLLANRLVVLCTNMVSVSQNINQSSDGVCVNSNELAINISVGEYKVDSLPESGVVVRELIAFQLRALHSFSSSLARMHESQSADFTVAKNKIMALMQRLQGNNQTPVPK